MCLTSLAPAHKRRAELRNNVTFDVNPTYPRIDIQPTGSCEFWIRNMDLVRYKLKASTEQPTLHTHTPPLILPEIYSSRLARIYSTDGKCLGMMAPECLSILHTAFQTAKLRGFHNNMTLAAGSFDYLPGKQN